MKEQLLRRIFIIAILFIGYCNIVTMSIPTPSEHINEEVQQAPVEISCKTNTTLTTE